MSEIDRPRQRDSLGRWLPGVTGNPKGRPVGRSFTKFIEPMREQVSLEDWRKIVQKAVEQASAGDHLARAWLSKYLLPEPAREMVNVSAAGVTVRVVFAQMGDREKEKEIEWEAKWEEAESE